MELISPEDLLQAAKQIGTLRLGCRLRTFPSGLMVLQLDSFSEDAIVDKIEDILEAARVSVVGSRVRVMCSHLSCQCPAY